MKVLVSGGTGLVGRYIVEELLAAGYSVIVGARRPPMPGLFSRPVDFVPLSLDPDSDQIDAFDDAYFFVHAAFAHVPGRYRGGEGDDPEGFRRLNLDGTVRLFETARRTGTLGSWRLRQIASCPRSSGGRDSPGQKWIGSASSTFGRCADRRRHGPRPHPCPNPRREAPLRRSAEIDALSPPPPGGTPVARRPAG